MDAAFDDIRPYNDDEITMVLRRLAGNRSLAAAIRKEIFPRVPSGFGPFLEYLIKRYLLRRVRAIQTVELFQRRITSDVVLNWVIEHTSDGLTFAGLENLEHGKSHIFISNHRDIVLDSALLAYVTGNNGFGIPAISFGDNLMVNELVTDLIRANKSFVVKRSLPPREMAREAGRLSMYIWSLQEQGESVWLAQREGRAKDGDDRTNPALIKMLYLSQRKGGLPFGDYIRKAGIVPVAISYEKDPCDLSKARELFERAANSNYEKPPGADARSMYLGLRKGKGRIHISIGNPLRGEYADEKEVALDIDRAIHSMYKLWPTNYIAYDALNDSEAYGSHYSENERAAFLQRFEREREEVRGLALEMYARPVINKRALLGEPGDGFP
jgi:1-acyl-sn-glycerol-3-phosphate acyltransferase